jgi:hypothetical protein
MHEVWHVVVLAATLLGATGLALVVLAPLLFEDPPPGLTRARPVLLALAAGAALLLLAEWHAVHSGSI